MGPIFISYRREEAEGQAGRLYDDLVQFFGQENVFMDVVGIEPGRDFRQAIDEKIAACGVMLVIIGNNWSAAMDGAGQRRLDQPLDFVRLEIASALKREIPVIPVLVRGATMPTATSLPEDIANLAYRNAVELSHARWDSDVELLVKALHSHLSPLQKSTVPPAVEAKVLSGDGGTSLLSTHAQLSPDNTGKLLLILSLGLLGVFGLGNLFMSSLDKKPAALQGDPTEAPKTQVQSPGPAVQPDNVQPNALPQRSDAVIIYARALTADDPLPELLRRAGFAITIQPPDASIASLPINSIGFESNVPLATIKEVALLLLRAGVELKDVGPVCFEMDGSRLVILHEFGLNTRPALTEQQIQSSTNFVNPNCPRPFKKLGPKSSR